MADLAPEQHPLTRYSVAKRSCDAGPSDHTGPPEEGEDGGQARCRMTVLDMLWAYPTNLVNAVC